MYTKVKGKPNWILLKKPLLKNGMKFYKKIDKCVGVFRPMRRLVIEAEVRHVE